MQISRRALLTVISSLLVLNIFQGAAGLAYISHYRQQDDQRWCPILKLTNRSNPPNATPDQIRARAELSVLRKKLGC